MTGRFPFFGRSGGPGGWGDEPDDPLVERLDLLAARAEPGDDEAIARVAATTQAAFEAAAVTWRSGDPAVERTETSPVSVTLLRPVSHAPRRLPAKLAAAAVFVLVVAGLGAVATVQAGPGQPFYGLRIALEGILLPVESAARLEAQLDRLDGRLAEAELAANADDWPAAGDALRAYGRIAIETAGAGGDDVARERALLQCAEIERFRARPGGRPWAGDIDTAGTACARLVRAIGGPVEETSSPDQPRGTEAPGPAASPGGRPSPSAGPGGSSPGGGVEPAGTSPGPGQASPSPIPGGTGGQGGGGRSTPEPSGGGPVPSSGPGGPGGGSGGGSGSGPGSGGGGAGGSSPAPDPSGSGSGGSGMSDSASPAPDPSAGSGSGSGGSP